MEKASWPTEWTRSALPGAVVALVSDEEAYGYVIAQRLASAGFGAIKGSTLYPLLARLEQDGTLVSTWREGIGGPGRKYYTVTATGEQWLDEFRTAWADFTMATTTVLAKTKGAE
jgi:PadR family transcriptional regulator, regulatory protein PadR